MAAGAHPNVGIRFELLVESDTWFRMRFEARE